MDEISVPNIHLVRVEVTAMIIDRTHNIHERRSRLFPVLFTVVFCFSSPAVGDWKDGTVTVSPSGRFLLSVKRARVGIPSEWKIANTDATPEFRTLQVGYPPDYGGPSAIGREPCWLINDRLFHTDHIKDLGFRGLWSDPISCETGEITFDVFPFERSIRTDVPRVSCSAEEIYYPYVLDGRWLLDVLSASGNLIVSLDCGTYKKEDRLSCMGRLSESVWLLTKCKQGMENYVVMLCSVNGVIRRKRIPADVYPRHVLWPSARSLICKDYSKDQCVGISVDSGKRTFAIENDPWCESSPKRGPLLIARKTEEGLELREFETAKETEGRLVRSKIDGIWGSNTGKALYERDGKYFILDLSSFDEREIPEPRE